MRPPYWSVQMPSIEADQRAGQDRRADQQAELRVVEPQVLLDLDADDGEDRPHREADGEGDGRSPQRPLLIDFAYFRQVLHGIVPKTAHTVLMTNATWPSSHL